jgi:hypothetical protein
MASAPLAMRSDTFAPAIPTPRMRWCVRVHHHLHDAVGFAPGEGAAERTVGELADLHVVAALLRFGLGRIQTERDFGVGEDRARHRRHVVGVLLAGDDRRRDEAFLRRLVGERRAADTVADGEDLRIRRAELGVRRR